jgi:hypothetical protein
MKGIYLIILYILSFSFQGNAQSIDALKNLDKIVISGPSGGVYFLPKPIRQKASDLSNFVAKEYERLFIKVFEELDIRVVKYNFDETPPLFLTTSLYPSLFDEKEVELKFELYILEPATLTRTNTQIKIKSWIAEENYRDVYYNSFDDLKFIISNKIEKLVNEFELDFYRVNRK